MTPEQRQYRIDVYTAWLDGKEVEVRDRLKCWLPCDKPCWLWDSCDYRVKPQKPLEFFAPVFANGSVGYHFDTYEEAKERCSQPACRHPGIRVAKFREVVE